MSDPGASIVWGGNNPGEPYDKKDDLFWVYNVIGSYWNIISLEMTYHYQAIPGLNKWFHFVKNTQQSSLSHMTSLLTEMCR